VRLWCMDEHSGRPNVQPLVIQHEKVGSGSLEPSPCCFQCKLTALAGVLPVLGPQSRVAPIWRDASCHTDNNGSRGRLANVDLLVLHLRSCTALLCGAAQRDKVRDVQYSPQLGRVASLVSSGAVHLWDPHLRLARTVRVRCVPRPGRRSEPVAWRRASYQYLFPIFMHSAGPPSTGRAKAWHARMAVRCQCRFHPGGRCG
jgi:hypothetical protein